MHLWNSSIIEKLKEVKESLAGIWTKTKEYREVELLDLLDVRIEGKGLLDKKEEKILFKNLERINSINRVWDT